MICNGGFQASQDYMIRACLKQAGEAGDASGGKSCKLDGLSSIPGHGGSQRQSQHSSGKMEVRDKEISQKLTAHMSSPAVETRDPAKMGENKQLLDGCLQTSKCMPGYVCTLFHTQ